MDVELDIQKSLISSIDQEEEFKKASKIKIEIENLDNTIKSLKDEISEKTKELDVLKERIEES